MHGKFDPILPENQVYEFAEKIKDFGGEAEVRIYSSHGHFSLVRRTTSWHIWPFPLLKDILNFIRSNE
jgi:predicted esterase